MMSEGKISRRSALKVSLGAGATTAIAAPAIAQSTPQLSWRMTSSFPKTVDIQYGTGEVFAKHVSDLTDGRFRIQSFAAGELVPGLQAADAVTSGAVEMCHTATYYYVGKDPTFALGTAIPFGMNTRLTNSWMYAGGGIDLLNEFYAKYNLFGLPCGNTTAQMGGWFRKEIKSVEDLRGLKMRIGGFAGSIISKLGVVPQQLAAGDIYPSLEKGTIDAAEWVGPYDDERLGFHKIAPNYYFPGWWEGGPCISVMFNLDKWNELPKTYQDAVKNAAAYATHHMVSRYDKENPGAVRRLVGLGVQIRPFPEDVMQASYAAAMEVYDELGRTNPRWKKIFDSYMGFKSEALLWHQICETSFDTFNLRIRQRP